MPIRSHLSAGLAAGLAVGALGAGLAGSASAEQFSTCGQTQADRVAAVGEISVTGPHSECRLATQLAADFQRKVTWKGRKPHILRYFWRGRYLRFVMHYREERGEDNPGVVINAQRGSQVISWSTDQ